MAVITKGHTFANGDQVTAVKLNNLADAATFASGAVDNVSTQLSGGGIIVKDGGVGTAKLADGAVTATKIAANAVADMVYPVGAIFTTVNNYADSAAVVSAIGGTTWVRFGAGRVLVGQDSGDTDFDTAEETGGAKTHQLTENEMPSHRHGGIEPAGSTGANLNAFDVDSPVSGDGTVQEKFTTETGNDQPHNNLQPYIVVYMWKRTA